MKYIKFIVYSILATIFVVITGSIWFYLLPEGISSKDDTEMFGSILITFFWSLFVAVIVKFYYHRYTTRITKTKEIV